jgi:hypothetical protein
MARSVVSLSGASSRDPDGSPLRFTWVQTAGPSVALVGANAALAIFVAPDVKDVTALRFRLQVDDGSLVSAPANITVQVRKFTGKGRHEDDELGVATAQVSGGCASAQSSSFAPLFLLLGFGLLRKRRASA